MGFADRTQLAEDLVKFIEQHVWSQLQKKRVVTVPYGYENHIDDNVRSRLRYNRVKTAKHIRFTPDYFVIDQNKPSTDENAVYLLEYKATQTPLYSPKRIELLKIENARPHLERLDIGQMEEDAYDNYLSLHNSGIRVAILNYCAYHARPLLCDFIERIQLLHRDTVGMPGGGSGTPFVNFDCNSMRSLDVFLLDEHKVQLPETYYKRLVNELKKRIPLKESERSPYRKAQG